MKCSQCGCKVEKCEQCSAVLSEGDEVYCHEGEFHSCSVGCACAACYIEEGSVEK
jgi:hypothetical protein